MCYNVYTGTNTKCVTRIWEVIKMDTVFDNIRAECARRHITIDELADKLGIERKTFYNWENRKDFPVSMLKKMASLFGITTDELLGLK